MMRILMVVLNCIGEGTYWRAYNYAIKLASHGHKVSLIASSPKSLFRLKIIKDDNINLVESPDLLPGKLRSGWDIWNTIRRILWIYGKDFDIVHAFETRPTVLFPALAAKHQGACLIFDWADWLGRGGSVEERENPIIRTLLRPIETHFENHYRTYSSGTTVINTFLFNRAVDLGVDPDTILLLRNGSNASIKIGERTEARTELGLSLDNFIIGFVGRSYLNDAIFMAKAYNKLAESITNVTLLLIGYFNRDIMKYVLNPTSVIQTGTLHPDLIYKYLSACDISWLPLTNTGANIGRWPLKLNDYMSVGRPVVATNVGDLEQVISQNEIGVVSAPNVISFVDHTISLLNNNEYRNHLSKTSRLAAEKEFNWNNLTTKLENFYVHILNKKTDQIQI